MLIVRDALRGLTRFDELQRNLGIAPNMLTRRLSALVEAGLLERRTYSERPRRYEYVPTARGRDFYPVLVSLLEYGNRHFAPDGERVVLVDRQTGARAQPMLIDRVSGRPIREGEHAFAAKASVGRGRVKKAGPARRSP